MAVNRSPGWLVPWSRRRRPKGVKNMSLAPNNRRWSKVAAQAAGQTQKTTPVQEFQGY